MISFLIFDEIYVALRATGHIRCSFNVLFVWLRSLSINKKFPLSWLESLRSDSHLPKKYISFAPIRKFFKNYEKCFLFRYKSSFRSQDIEIFVLIFWSCRQNGLIRKLRLISKFMTSQQKDSLNRVFITCGKSVSVVLNMSELYRVLEARNHRVKKLELETSS